MAIRAARPGDAPAILDMIVELATYERAAEAVRASVADLRTALFGPDPQVSCHLAEQDGEVVGFALWFLSFSTWTGRHGIYLEDLYVRAHARGQGHGRALLTALAGVCAERRFARLEWSVLDWNADAIGFYRSLGALPMQEWTVHRLEGEELRALATGPVGVAAQVPPTPPASLSP